MILLGSSVKLVMIDFKSTHWQSYQTFDPKGLTAQIFRVPKNTASYTINPAKSIPNALYSDVCGPHLLRIKPTISCI